LNRLKSVDGHLQVVNEDILKFPLQDELRKILAPNKKAKVIANLPYHITTPIIEMLITQRDVISDIIVMVQEEVARRFVGKPGTKDYSSFTIFLNYYSHPHYAFKVGRNCFFPAPKVDSAIVRLVLREPPVVSNEKAFFEMTRTAFVQRRKMMRGSLRKLYASGEVEKGLESMGKPVETRPEELSLDEMILLFEKLVQRA
jgi:16S rRNA (adenine1518-N6/adenine1519-N6)-dimethyltransferase